MKCTFERAVQDRLKEQSRLGGERSKGKVCVNRLDDAPFGTLK